MHCYAHAFAREATSSRPLKLLIRGEQLAMANHRVKRGRDKYRNDYAKKRAWVKRVYRERRNAWISSQGSQCAQCGTSTPRPYRSAQGRECDGWHLAHRDPATKISHSIWTWSKVRREAELAKCELNCGDCNLQEMRDRRGYQTYKRAEQYEIEQLEEAPF